MVSGQEFCPKRLPLLLCLTLFFPHFRTLRECERAHVRSDILPASSPQCPLTLPPSLPPSLSLPQRTLPHRLVFSPFTLNLRLPVPFHLASSLPLLSPPAPSCLLYLILSFPPPPLPFPPSPLMCVLCHIPMILSLFHSLALVGSVAFLPPSSQPPPLLLSTTTLSPRSLSHPSTPFSLSLWLIR